MAKKSGFTELSGPTAVTLRLKAATRSTQIEAGLVRVGNERIVSSTYTRGWGDIGYNYLIGQIGWST